MLMDSFTTYWTFCYWLGFFNFMIKFKFTNLTNKITFLDFIFWASRSPSFLFTLRSIYIWSKHKVSTSSSLEYYTQCPGFTFSPVGSYIVSQHKRGIILVNKLRGQSCRGLLLLLFPYNQDSTKSHNRGKSLTFPPIKWRRSSPLQLWPFSLFANIIPPLCWLTI